MTDKKTLILLTAASIISLFIANSCYSQSLTGSDWRINFSWDFYSDNRLSSINAGKGYTGIAGDNDISGILLNPATLSLNKRFQGHVEYMYKSNVPIWQSYGFGEFDLKQYHPSLLAAFGYRLSKYFQTGVLFYTASSYKFIHPERSLLNEFGDSIGTYQPYEQTSISSIVLPIVYNYKNRLKVGVNLLYSFYHGYAYYGPMSIGPAEGKANFSKFNAELGLVVLPVKDLSIGVTFTPKSEENVVWEWPQGVKDSFATPNVFPMKIGLGGEYRFRKIPLKLAFDYVYFNSYKQDGLNDRNDIHFGAEYEIMKAISVRAGFFSLKDYRNGYDYFEPIGQYDEYFLTIGGTYKFKNFSASIAVMDSHILSTGLISQTLVNGGFTLDFK